MAKVLGIGGIFFKSKDPDALKQWYVDNLGAPDGEDPGISFRTDGPSLNKFAVFGPFKADTSYFEPSQREFMFNLVVDDLQGVLQRVQDAGGKLVGEIEEYDFGRFGWFVDPDGNKVELWQPPT